MASRNFTVTVTVADLYRVNHALEAGARLQRQVERFLSDDSALTRNAETMRQALDEYRAVMLAMADGD